MNDIFMNDWENPLTSLISGNTEVANTTVVVTWYGLLLLMFMCVRVCVCEQEAATVAAAEAAPVPKVTSGTAPDSEPDEPKDTETEETVSHHWWSANRKVESLAAVQEIPVHSDLTGCRTLAALSLLV